MADEKTTETATKKTDPKPAPWRANSIPMKTLVFDRERAVPGHRMTPSLVVLTDPKVGVGITSIEFCPAIRHYYVTQNRAPAPHAQEFLIHESKVDYAVPL